MNNDDFRQAVAATPDNITDEMYTYADEFIVDFRANIPALLEDKSLREDEFKTVLMLWSVFLGVLAMEAFESMMILFKANKLRGAIMIARPIIDYSVRLRYYILQSEKMLLALKLNPAIDRKHIQEQMQALRDWNNADTKLLGIIGLYPTEVYPEQERATILEGLAEKQRSYDQRFGEIIKIAAKRNRRHEDEYRNATLSAWLNASAFLHGDQAIITDVVRTKENMVHFESASALPRTTMMEAVWHMQDLLESFSMVRGWNIGGYKWFVKWSRFFMSQIRHA